MDIVKYCNFDKRINEMHARLDEIELENKKVIGNLNIDKDKASRGESCNSKKK